MANRVTDSEVKKLISTDFDTAPFITAANLIVTAQLGSSGLSSDHLKEIERWLSAHFIAVADSDKNLSRRSIGDTEVYYGGKTGLNLDFTRFGQQVKVLDTTNTLANLGKIEASIKAIEAIDIDSSVTSL